MVHDGSVRHVARVYVVEQWESSLLIHNESDLYKFLYTVLLPISQFRNNEISSEACISQVNYYEPPLLFYVKEYGFKLFLDG